MSKSEEKLTVIEVGTLLDNIDLSLGKGSDIEHIKKNSSELYESILKEIGQLWYPKTKIYKSTPYVQILQYIPGKGGDEGKAIPFCHSEESDVVLIHDSFTESFFEDAVVAKHYSSVYSHEEEDGDGDDDGEKKKKKMGIEEKRYRLINDGKVPIKKDRLTTSKSDRHYKAERLFIMDDDSKKCYSLVAKNKVGLDMVGNLVVRKSTKHVKDFDTLCNELLELRRKLRPIIPISDPVGSLKRKADDPIHNKMKVDDVPKKRVKKTPVVASVNPLNSLNDNQDIGDMVIDVQDSKKDIEDEKKKTHERDMMAWFAEFQKKRGL